MIQFNSRCFVFQIFFRVCLHYFFRASSGSNWELLEYQIPAPPLLCMHVGMRKEKNGKTFGHTGNSIVSSESRDLEWDCVGNFCAIFEQVYANICALRSVIVDIHISRMPDVRLLKFYDYIVKIY